MKYLITHITKYEYTTPVSVCHNAVILTPAPSSGLSVESHRLDIHPVPEIAGSRRDVFGNSVHRFSLEQVHSELTIEATSQVTVRSRDLPDAAASPTCSEVSESIDAASDPDWLSVAPFLFNSPRIIRSDTFRDYAASCLQPDAPIIAAAQKLTHRIYTDFKYDKDATQVDTPTSTAFENRHGVCQDFAHVAVACFRSCGLPARYVSGYLRTIPAPGKERLVGADQSHAWVSVYCGSKSGWIDFDPTNDCIVGTDHVGIATGRDYSDVVPIKGVFLGGGEPTLSVSVDVAPIDVAPIDGVS